MTEPRNESSDPFEAVPPPARGPRGFRRIERGPAPAPQTGLVETLVIAFFVLVVVNAFVWLIVVLVLSAARH